jgi:hypothetical protein
MSAAVCLILIKNAGAVSDRASFSTREKIAVIDDWADRVQSLFLQQDKKPGSRAGQSKDSFLSV